MACVPWKGSSVLGYRHHHPRRVTPSRRRHEVELEASGATIAIRVENLSKVVENDGSEQAAVASSTSKKKKKKKKKKSSAAADEGDEEGDEEG